jgi:hypothetical protein
VANTLKLYRNGAVGFIGWLDVLCAIIISVVVTASHTIVYGESAVRRECEAGEKKVTCANARVRGVRTKVMIRTNAETVTRPRIKPISEHEESKNARQEM